MTVTIRPDDEQLIARVIRTGAYQNADEVIARALEVLRSDEEWLDESKSAIGEKIDRAFEQFDRGQSFSAEASKGDMEARKAAWLRGQQAGTNRFTRFQPKRRTTCSRSGNGLRATA